MQREVPILFSGPMVDAILAGRKTQTRGALHTPYNWPIDTFLAQPGTLERLMNQCVYQVGDVLWVKDWLFMPRDKAKIWLECTGRWIENVHDTTEANALAHGIDRLADDGEQVYGIYGRKLGKLERIGWHSDPIHSFATLIDAECGPGTWNNNRPLWVISFKVISTTGRP